MRYCVLRNTCTDRDICCSMCKNKKCSDRCLDNPETCKFCASKPREWFKPVIQPKPEVEVDKKEENVIPKTVAVYAEKVKTYYKEKSKTLTGSKYIHHVVLNPGWKTKTGDTKFNSESLIEICSILRKTKHI